MKLSELEASARAEAGQWMECDSDAILKLVEIARAARAVALSNGFDAALPDKQAALREALKGVEL